MKVGIGNEDGGCNYEENCIVQQTYALMLDTKVTEATGNSCMARGNVDKSETLGHDQQVEELWHRNVTEKRAHQVYRTNHTKSLGRVSVNENNLTFTKLVSIMKRMLILPKPAGKPTAEKRPFVDGTWPDELGIKNVLESENKQEWNLMPSYVFSAAKVRENNLNSSTSLSC